MHVGINAHLLSRSSTYRAAGISRHIRNLLAALARIESTDRFTVFVGPGVEIDRRFVRRASALPTERPPLRIGWEQVIAPLELLRHRIDVLHSPAYAAPLLNPCPSVVTVHDLSFERHPRLFRPGNRAYLRAITRLSVARARRVIAVSESTKRELVALYRVPETRITVIPNGVEPEFRPMESAEIERFRAERGLPEQFILYLGTLEPRKNVGTLVRAYATLRRERGVPHMLVLAGGKGWLYDEIFAEVRALGLERDVLFPGFVPFEEQPLWYNAAAAFAFPSLYEGFGMPPLEAMACGTPVVCANTTSLPEVVADAGLLVPPTDEAALAEALWRTIDDTDLRNRLRADGIARATLFDWDAIARRTLAVYHEAALERAVEG